jgi:cytochrome c556
MRKLLIVAGAALLCSAAWAADADTLYIRDAMADGVNPATTELWDIGNNAMGDDGAIDPALMDEAKWATLERAAGQLENAAGAMAAAPSIKSAQPGTQAESGATMEEIQAFIDADPQGFRLMAQALSQYAGKISVKAKARDPEAGLLVGELQEVCESCHLKYWYPEG